MKDFKIGIRIGIGFAVVLATAVGFGAWAYSNAEGIDQSAEQLQKVTLPTVYLSEDLRNSAQREFALLQQFLTSKDQGEREGLNAALLSERTRGSELVSKLDGVANSDKMRRSFHAMKPAREEFQRSSDRAIDLTKTATLEGNQPAVDVEAATIRPAYAKLLGLADAMVDVSRKAAQGQPRNSDSPGLAASSRILLFLGAAVLLAIVISIRVSRSVTKPMLEAIGVLEQVFNGDLTCRLKRTSQDELGQLLNRLNRLLDNHWNAAGVAERLGEGDFTVHVSTVSERDVLGRGLARMRNNLQASVEAVERLSAGEFSAQPRAVSEKDKLGNALAHLREVLKTAADATKRISEGDFEVQTAAAAGGAQGESLLRIRDQLKATTWLAAKLAEGELIALDSLPGAGSALSRPLISLHERLMASTRMMERISEGDLNVQVQARSQNDVFGQAMVRMLESLRRIAGEVIASASQVAGVSLELIATAARLSQSSSEHTATASETAAVLGGMAESLRQSADQSHQTDRLASAAAQDGRLSAEAIHQAVAAMKEVADRLALLDEIGRKSDMLTLAAAVEAARAGDHGSGFGVVASELRKVVEQSQTAASEIHRLSLGGVKTAESAVEFLTRLVPGVSKTAELVRELASASAEQNSGATRAGKAIQQLDKVIHESVWASQQMAETAGHLVSHANVLQTTISFFKLAEPVATEAPVVSPVEALLVRGAGL